MSSSDYWPRWPLDRLCDLVRDSRVVRMLSSSVFAESLLTGTQMKLIATFDNGERAVMKPGRCGRVCTRVWGTVVRAQI